MSPCHLPPRVAPLAAALLMLLTGPGCSGPEPRPDSTRAAAPGFAGDIDGFDLGAYEGKVVVLNFWATWCGPCRIEVPALVRLRRDFEPERVAIIGISLDAYGTREEIEGQIVRFVERYEINYPVYLDSRQKVARHYDEGSDFMRFVPTTVVIDSQGRVQRTHQGVPRARDGGIDPYGVLATEVRSLLGES